MLTNVQICIPMGGAHPEVGDVDCGTHSYDPSSQNLIWCIDKIDGDNNQGSMEVWAAGLCVGLAGLLIATQHH